MSPLAEIVAGVLIAGLFLGGMGLGAALLRLTGRLVGGAWSEVAPLRALAAFAPLPLIVAFAARIVLTLGSPATGYAAGGWMTLRLVIACAVWVLVALLGACRSSRAISAAALVAFGASIPPMAFDLITSLEPHWLSSAETYAVPVRMLGSALAAALLVPLAERDRRDLQGLLVATLLATLYLNLMSYLIPWYGDLPDKTGWIRLRQAPVWEAIIIAALALGAAAPPPLLALQRRLGQGAARLAAGLALAGFFAQTVWLVAPPFGAFALFGAIGFSGIGLIALWTRTFALRRPAHG